MYFIEQEMTLVEYVWPLTDFTVYTNKKNVFNTIYTGIKSEHMIDKQPVKKQMKTMFVNLKYDWVVTY